MHTNIRICRELFRKHSVTYYYSTWFFPKSIRHDVYVLYAFVRLADEIVDNPSTEPTIALNEFRQMWHRAWDGDSVDHPVISTFVTLAKRHHFDHIWIDAFLHSMEQDLTKTHYSSKEDLLTYVYGSADVIGLMMARIMHVPDDALPAAQALGTYMQLINFVRDIKEDGERGRIYIPQDMLQQAGVNLDVWMDASKDTEKKRLLVADMLSWIHSVYQTAHTGFARIPGRSRFAVRLASNLYTHVGNRIASDPLLPFTTSIRTTKLLVLSIFLHTLSQHA